jgi:hypothetical protein
VRDWVALEVYDVGAKLQARSDRDKAHGLAEFDFLGGLITNWVTDYAGAAPRPKQEGEWRQLDW